MKKLAFLSAIALFASSAAFAFTTASNVSGAGTASGATATSGPGSNFASTVTSGYQNAGADSKATSTNTLSGSLWNPNSTVTLKNHVEGQTYATGGSTSTTVTSGNAIGASGTIGHSGGNSAATAGNVATNHKFEPVSGLTTGSAESRNTNVSASGGAFGLGGSATQMSGNQSTFTGDANAFTNLAGTQHSVLSGASATSGTLVVNPITNATSGTVVNTSTGLSLNGPLANFGNAGANGAAVSGNLSAVAP